MNKHFHRSLKCFEIKNCWQGPKNCWLLPAAISNPGAPCYKVKININKFNKISVMPQQQRNGTNQRRQTRSGARDDDSIASLCRDARKKAVEDKL